MSATRCHSGLPSTLAHRSQTALTSAAVARWMTPFSGPSQRSCPWLTSSRQNAAPVADQLVEVASDQERGQLLDGRAAQVVAPADRERHAHALVLPVGLEERRRRPSSRGLVCTASEPARVREVGARTSSVRIPVIRVIGCSPPMKAQTLDRAAPDGRAGGRGHRIERRNRRRRSCSGSTAGGRHGGRPRPDRRLRRHRRRPPAKRRCRRSSTSTDASTCCATTPASAPWATWSTRRPRTGSGCSPSTCSASPT